MLSSISDMMLLSFRLSTNTMRSQKMERSSSR